MTVRAADGPAAAGPPRRRVLRGPLELPARSWWAVLRRTVHEYQADNLSDRAAALTYYGILALFPALLAVVSVLGLLGQSATQTLIDNLGTVAPGSSKKIVVDAIRNLQHNQSTSGVLFVVGLAGALWAASGYVGAFIRASNAIYEVPEGRPFYKLRPLQLGVTALLVAMTSVCAVAVVFTGGLARRAGDLLGLGSTAVDVWDIAKWPAIILVVITMLAILYWVAPNVKMAGFRWITPGGVVGVLVWLVASLAFSFYVANFGSYNKTYGTMGAVIIFLTWLWITNVAALLGAELNAELERERELSLGESEASTELQLPRRVNPRRRHRPTGG